jgi:hypothetical protein
MSQNVPERPRPVVVARSVRGTAGRALGAVASILPSVAVGLLAILAAAWLAAASAVLVVLGAGLVVVVALVVLGGALLARRGRTSPWFLVPLLAVAVPAVVVAASGVRVEAQHGVEVHVPLTVDELPRGGYRTGLGEQLVDLRALDLPARRTITVKARSDLDRTVVALPRDACWNLDVRWHTGSLWLPGVSTPRWVSGLDPAGRRLDVWSRRTRAAAWNGVFEGRIALFGRVRRERRGRWVSRVADPAAPTVRIDLRSLGSSFAVRDYPDDIGPLQNTTWPLNLQPPASPAERRAAWSSPGRSARSAREWRTYRADRVAFARRSKELMDGGCGRKVVTG